MMNTTPNWHKLSTNRSRQSCKPQVQRHLKMHSLSNTSNETNVALINSSPNSVRSKIGRTKTPRGDRFIPVRSVMDLEIAHYHLTKDDKEPLNDEYNTQLAQALFDGKLDSKILSFQDKPPRSPTNRIASPILSSPKRSPKPAPRTISTEALDILDASGVVNNYYSNILDWSSQNIVAVALGESVHLVNVTSAETTVLTELEDEVASLNWAQGGNLAIGLKHGCVELWDANQEVRVNKLRGNQGRVGALSWNGPILSAGSMSGIITNYDVRCRSPLVSTFDGHSSEICGLKWNANGTALASGGNDDLVNVWDMSRSTPKFTFSEHKSAVKAIAWCPWKDILATGGGTNDRSIKFWNTTTGSCINTIKTQGQVTQLAWSKTSECQEIVSSHGSPTSTLAVWNLRSHKPIAEFIAHRNRILCMAQNPDGTEIATIGADERLCFWEIFPRRNPIKKIESQLTSTSSILRIR
eukprot:TRINITY_DN4152_c0_g1_i5.p1 TRINITY_DN4152_c0_g1~~TRINITY_DN4152_c0_g1_i5.p1  ORF type:complete len:468 (+),score=99.03 TRINITY_DN4152_c0_g1_i5:266-1669(+)